MVSRVSKVSQVSNAETTFLFGAVKVTRTTQPDLVVYH